MVMFCRLVKCNKMSKCTAVPTKKMSQEVKAQDREQCIKDDARGLLAQNYTSGRSYIHGIDQNLVGRRTASPK